MGYLLDTCTISELTRDVPDSTVVSWFKGRDEGRLFLSVITVGEIERGIYRLPSGKKRIRLETWLYDGVVSGFLGRILEVRQQTMSMWAKLNADLQAKGVSRPAFDLLIEATAIEHDLILVTRNVQNFCGSSATILNPWED